MQTPKARTSRRTLRKIWSRFFGNSLKEASRSGKIVQTLWDASQIQKEEQALLIQAGRRAMELLDENKLNDHKLLGHQSKIKQIHRILERQDKLLKSYQQRSDVRAVLQSDNQENKDNLAPV